MRVCDICKKEIREPFLLVNMEDWDSDSKDNDLRLELCREHYMELKGVIEDWMKGGQCITLVGEDGKEIRLPMPSVPEGTKRLEDFDGVRE